MEVGDLDCFSIRISGLLLHKELRVRKHQVVLGYPAVFRGSQDSQEVASLGELRVVYQDFESAVSIDIDGGEQGVRVVVRVIHLLSVYIKSEPGLLKRV